MFFSVSISGHIIRVAATPWKEIEFSTVSSLRNSPVIRLQPEFPLIRPSAISNLTPGRTSKSVDKVSPYTLTISHSPSNSDKGTTENLLLNNMTGSLSEAYRAILFLPARLTFFTVDNTSISFPSNSISGQAMRVDAI